MATRTRRAPTKRVASRNSTRSTTSRSSREVQDARRSQQQMAVAAESTSALLRGAEIWTQLQLNALQRSAQTWREAAEQIRSARTALDLVAAHNQLMMNSWVQAMQAGQELVQAVAAARTEVPAPVQDQAPAAAESVPPIMQVWQTMMKPMVLDGAAAATH
jgi:hypothetical protein